ncbi:hypothetical protein SAMN02746009_00003 [Hymenobacter psychrotolerans DSM 18569]|uniref:Uncharacterized protein n=1 Tax=Hymenobacter psychrotolerans DSM 18569 TaxID=1121959 RepID=A0A1M6NT45_9BACT|nr:hypothetical protein SAMN02746009_00003 [Hymenobacter psychrotolerans DSM 18569]
MYIFLISVHTSINIFLFLSGYGLSIKGCCRLLLLHGVIYCYIIAPALLRASVIIPHHALDASGFRNFNFQKTGHVRYMAAIIHTEQVLWLSLSFDNNVLQFYPVEGILLAGLLIADPFLTYLSIEAQEWLFLKACWYSSKKRRITGLQLAHMRLYGGQAPCFCSGIPIDQVCIHGQPNSVCPLPKSKQDAAILAVTDSKLAVRLTVPMERFRQYLGCAG